MASLTDSRSGVVNPGPTSHCCHEGTTVPDDSGPHYLGLATEDPGVLVDFNFCHHFFGARQHNDSDLLGAFSHVSD